MNHGACRPEASEGAACAVAPCCVRTAPNLRVPVPSTPRSATIPPPMDQPLPKKADLVTPFVFRITWNDGLVHDYAARDLRLACPCASCVDEGTGRPLLDPRTVADGILLFGAELVGRYGLSFFWSDGHKTGIFHWRRLRELGGLRSGS